MNFDSQPRLLRILLDSDIVRPSNCHAVRMESGSRLTLAQAEPRSAHIVVSGVASNTVCMLNGNRALIDTHCRGDLIEVPHLLGLPSTPTEVCVTVPGEAVRIPFALLRKAFQKDRDFREAVLISASVHCLAAQKLAACNLFHTLEERLARYLLTLNDQSGVLAFPLTQEYMAGELGVQRTSLVVAVGDLRRKGSIQFSRRRIEIVARERLEEITCECYQRPLSSEYRLPAYPGVARKAGQPSPDTQVAA